MASLVNDEAADLTLVALLAESPGKNQVRKYVSCDDLPRGRAIERRFAYFRGRVFCVEFTPSNI